LVSGGSEYGYDWHANGRLNHKQNSITDLMSCATYLVDHGFTTRSLMCAYTASAGALTLAAAINTQPDLFQAAVMKVPFVDPIGSMLDDSQPLTAHEIDEWGDPARNNADLQYLLSYSPYQNLPPIPKVVPPASTPEANTSSVDTSSLLLPPQYPHMLITSAMNDPRVPYWQPAKYVAKLRALNPNNFM
jgi:oligopeptidase B